MSKLINYQICNSLNLFILVDDCFADYDGDASDAYLRGYLTTGLDNNEILFTDNGGSPDDVHYYFKDGLGSIRQIIDDAATPAIEAYLDYYAFGSTYNVSGETSNLSGNRYLYTSRELNSESSDYYYRARNYNTTLGQFTSSDPLGDIDSPNLYTYVLANPTNFTDPTGFLTAYERWLVNLSESEVNKRAEYILKTFGMKYLKAFLSALNKANHEYTREQYHSKRCRVGITVGPSLRSTGHHTLSSSTYDCSNWVSNTSSAEAFFEAAKCSQQSCGNGGCGCIDRLDIFAEENDINWTESDLFNGSAAFDYIERLDLCQPCDIWILSCRFCATSEGRGFAERLAELTGCTVHCTRYFITLTTGGAFRVSLTEPNTMTKITSSVGVLGIGMLAVGLLFGNPFLIGAGIGAILIGGGINYDSFGNPFANPRTVLNDPWKEYN